MRIFLGGGGVIGSRLIPRLVRAGHVVAGSTHSERTAAVLKAAGVEPSIVDVTTGKLSGKEARSRGPRSSSTSLPNFRRLGRTRRARPRRSFGMPAPGKRGTRTSSKRRARSAHDDSSRRALLGAGSRATRRGRSARVRSGWAAPDHNGWGLALERLVLSSKSLEGLVLRYGQLYGPGTRNAEPLALRPVRVEAAADAVALAVTRGTAGIYNIVDDGSAASNPKARRTLGWTPYTTR